MTAVPHPAPVVEPSTERLLAQAAARIEALERRRRADHDDFDTHFAWIAGASLSPDPVPDWSEWLIDGPVGFWPLINDLLDVSGNDHHLVLSSGSYVVTGGLTGIAEFTTGLSLASGSDWTVEATINCNVDDFAIYGFGEVVVADGDEPGPGAGLTASGGSGGGPLRFGARDVGADDRRPLRGDLGAPRPRHHLLRWCDEALRGRPPRRHHHRW